jgi:energy-converting hydrogenase Eha subunit E
MKLPQRSFDTCMDASRGCGHSRLGQLTGRERSKILFKAGGCMVMVLSINCAAGSARTPQVPVNADAPLTERQHLVPRADTLLVTLGISLWFLLSEQYNACFSIQKAGLWEIPAGLVLNRHPSPLQHRVPRCNGVYPMLSRTQIVP